MVAAHRGETMSTALALLVYPVILGTPFVYEGLFLQWNGQTIGKRALGIMVVKSDGAGISAGQAWGRAAMRLVLGFCWLVDYVPAFFVKDKRCLHDLAASTWVVRVPH
jgi:uncharacterized RDD family membrane protein YckC